MKKLLIPILLALFTACECADLTDDGNVTLSFIPTTADITRGDLQRWRAAPKVISQNFAYQPPSIKYSHFHI